MTKKTNRINNDDNNHNILPEDIRTQEFIFPLSADDRAVVAGDKSAATDDGPDTRILRKVIWSDYIAVMYDLCIS